MASKAIQRHFVRCLGNDVHVSVVRQGGPLRVIVYRRDRLDPWFVGSALEALRMGEPKGAHSIDELVVAHYNPMEGPCAAYSLCPNSPCGGAQEPRFRSL